MEKNDSGIRPLSGHFCNNGKNDSERQSFKPFNLKWWYNGHDEHAHNATSFCFQIRWMKDVQNDSAVFSGLDCFKWIIYCMKTWKEGVVSYY